MTKPFKVALVQVTAGPDPSANASANRAYLDKSAAAGAAFVLFPEVCNMIEPDRDACRRKARLDLDDQTVGILQDGAREHGVWVLIGSVVVRSETMPGKLANRSFLINDQGEIVATYDKMHLFDVDVGSDEVYRESDTYQAGSGITLASTPWGPLGMTICYDLRFPHLYRDLAKAGAVMLTVPSAFTRPTGEAHWHALLRARAIETGAFVLAPAQTGEHGGGRKTYGHSVVINPWGVVLADGDEEVDVTYVVIDPSEAASARACIPALKHDREYTIIYTNRD